MKEKYAVAYPRAMGFAEEELEALGFIILPHRKMCDLELSLFKEALDKHGYFLEGKYAYDVFIKTPLYGLVWVVVSNNYNDQFYSLLNFH